jgi:iron complex outermembrane receptor protein
VNGVEVGAIYRPIPRFYVDAELAYARSKIDNGLVACNPAGITNPSVAQIMAAAGGEAVAQCAISDRLSTAPDWSLNIQSEYSQPVPGNMDAFVRGLLSYFPSNPNDPTNPYDAVQAYATLNLFLGLHSPGGAWEVALFGKNITNTQRTLTRNDVAITASPINILSGGNAILPSNYVGVVETPPREFGISLRYAFGSR